MSVQSSMSQIIDRDFSAVGKIDRMQEGHEFRLAQVSVTTAMTLSQMEDMEKTAKQIQNNKIVTTLINNQLQFYRKDYDRIQNLVPNGYRA